MTLHAYCFLTVFMVQGSELYHKVSLSVSCTRKIEPTSQGYICPYSLRESFLLRWETQGVIGCHPRELRLAATYAAREPPFPRLHAGRSLPVSPRAQADRLKNAQVVPTRAKSAFTSADNQSSCLHAVNARHEHGRNGQGNQSRPQKHLERMCCTSSARLPRNTGFNPKGENRRNTGFNPKGEN